MAYVAKPEDGIAWITGASSGLGRALALKLVERGWTVAVTARNAVALETLVAAAGAETGAIVAFPGDVTKGGTIGQLVPRIEKKVGPIALAILAAGDQSPPDNPLDRQEFQRSIEVNLLGMTNCLGPVVEGMRSRGWGQVALVAGLSAHGGMPSAPCYGPARAAVVNLAESLHGPLLADGIRLQLVTPGRLGGRLPGEGWLAAFLSVSYERAADRVLAGLRRSGGFEIAFPKTTRWALWALRALPYPLFFRLTARLGRVPAPTPRVPRRIPKINEVEQ